MYKKFTQYLKMFRSRSVLGRLFLSYAVLLVIPLTLLGMLSSDFAIKRLKEQTELAIDTGVQMAQSRIVEKLNGIFNAAYNLSVDDVVMSYQATSGLISVDRALSIDKMNDLLSRVELQNDLIETALLWFPQKKEVITKETIKEDENFFKNHFLNSSLKYKEWRDYILEHKNTFSRVKFLSDTESQKEFQDCIVYIKKLDRSDIDNRSYAIFILKNSTIQNILEPIVFQNGNVLILDRFNNLLFYMGKGFDEAIFDSPKFHEELKIEENRVGFYNTKLDGKEVISINKEIGIHDLKISSLVEKNILPLLFSL